MKRNKKETGKVKCQWCGELTDENDLYEAGGCDIIPKGFMVCEKCINIPKAY